MIEVANRWREGDVWYMGTSNDLCMIRCCERTGVRHSLLLYLCKRMVIVCYQNYGIPEVHPIVFR